MKTPLLSALFTLIALLSTIDFYGQCDPPAALDCEHAPILCSLGELDGYACANPDISNPTGPNPMCFGVGVPNNTGWWAFVGNGDFIDIVINFDLADCKNQHGIQIGIIDDCGGDPLDCNANCNTSTLTLSGQTISCHIYYVWIDGCLGDICNYTLAVGGGGAPNLPNPLPKPKSIGSACIGESAMVCVDDLSKICDAKIQWTVDGADQVDFDDLNCLTIDILNETVLEVCVTYTIGNPRDPNSICDQASTCFVLVPDSVKIINDSIVYVCWGNHQGGGYLWRDMHPDSVYNDSIYVFRQADSSGCIIEYRADSFILLPPRPIKEKYIFFCDKKDLPYTTEDGQVWYKEACGEEITWSDKDYYGCDTSYILYMSFFDPVVTLTQNCGKCDGFTTLIADVEYNPDCINGNVSWIGYWLNDFQDTIGLGDKLEANETGTFSYVFHITYTDAITGMSQTCDLDGPWYINIKDIEEPQLRGITPICNAGIGDYEVLNPPADICEYSWSIKRGGGTIITTNPSDTSKIEVDWQNLIGLKGEVCVSYITDCGKSLETCFEVEFKDAPRPYAGEDREICGKDYKMDGTEDVPGGKWTIIASSGNVDFDKDDIKTDISVDSYGRYVFVWSERILTCIGNDTVILVFVDQKAPQFNNIQFECQIDNKAYRITFDIIGGDQNSIEVTQAGVKLIGSSGNSYQSNWVNNNNTTSIEVKDKFECDINKLDTIYDCMDVAVLDYNQTNMHLFPNPAHNNIYIIGDDLNEMNVQMVDINGLIISSLPKSVITGGLLIDINNLATGIYFIQIKNGNNLSVHRFIKI